MTTAFRITRCRLHWWIPLDVETVAACEQFLQPAALQFAGCMNWGFFETPQLAQPNVFTLHPFLREEVKAAVRKRSHLKGNAETPFVLWKHAQIPFEVSVYHFLPHSALLLLTTSMFELEQSPADLTSLSFLPSTPNKQLRYAIEKLAAYLTTGLIKARSAAPLKYSYYPLIQITDYAPRNPNARIADDVPWHHITSIGTRHRGINEDNTQLVPAYKAKNYSIRDDVCIIDKQSVVSIAADTQLEFEAVKICIGMALRMRGFLEAAVGAGAALSETPLEPLMERIRISHANPSVISDSVSFQKIWPIVLRELQVLDWVSNVEATLGQKWTAHDSLPVLLDRIDQLEQKVGHLSNRIKVVLDLLKTDIRSAWNYTRRVLEEVVKNIVDRTAEADGPRVTQENLSDTIEQLCSQRVIPSDIRACMDLIRVYGNIGSHTGSKVYNPSEAAMSFVLGALSQVLEWYAAEFLPSLEVECPSPSCHARQPKGRKFCTKCGTKLVASLPRNCPRCKKLLDDGMSFCPGCGMSLAGE